MSKLPTLSEITKRPEFFANCAEISLRVSKSADASEVAALLGEAASLLGADAAAFGSFVKDDETYESYRFIVACDATWCLEYERGRATCPILGWTMPAEMRNLIYGAALAGGVGVLLVHISRPGMTVHAAVGWMLHSAKSPICSASGLRACARHVRGKVLNSKAWHGSA